MSTHLITGTSRGLGLEFVQQILENEKGNKVIAAARKPEESKELVALHQKFHDRLYLVSLDISNTESVKAAAQQITEKYHDGIDYLINNAGASGSKNSDPEDFLHVFNTNVVGSFRVFQAFLPLLRKGSKKVVVQLSSALGSIAMQEPMHNFLKLVPGADFYGYRTSKAALNCLTVQLSLTHKEEGFVFLAIHPGLVDTDMYRGQLDLSKDNPIAVPKEKSVQGVLEVVHKATIADTGKFFKWDGTVLPW
eukprot:Phypoly_transcript_13929.p1 GENE.Phypoly_transcript_13929~~Phypoly_transcript_13929.p1  ORF type:complete len:250 (+),score=42.15 Phypoly_transcript_13929:186-935(+)